MDDSEANPLPPITDAQSFALASLYFSAAKDAADALDTRLFWSVGGVAALSAFACKELIVLKDNPFQWMMYVGWAFLLIAVLTILLQYRIAPELHLYWARYWLHHDDDDKKATELPRQWIDGLSNLAIACVVLATLSVGLFIAFSLSK